MPFGIGGDIVGRARENVDSRLVQQLALQQFQQQVEQQAAQEKRQQEQMEMQRQQQERLMQNDAEDREERRLTRERQATQDREAKNTKGVRAMMGDFLTQGTGPMSSGDRRGLARLQVEAGEQPDARLLEDPVPKRTNVSVPGPGGTSVLRAVPDDELAQGVTQYREPRVGPQPEYQWIMRGGKPMEIRKGASQPGDAPGGSGSTLTAEGLDVAALQYATTGSMPPLGMGASPMRSAIINRAAEMFPGLNIGSATADFRSDAGSLTAITKQLDGITAYEKTALKNLDVFLAQSKKVMDTGSPLLNAPIRRMSAQALGSPEMAAFNTARMVVLPEFARIITNPNLTGVLTDSARGEIEELLRGDATLAQITRTAAILKQDAENRRTSLEAQRQAIQGRIRQAQPSTGTPDAAAAPVTPPAAGGSMYDQYLRRRGGG